MLYFLFSATVWNFSQREKAVYATICSNNYEECAETFGLQPFVQAQRNISFWGNTNALGSDFKTTSVWRVWLVWTLEMASMRKRWRLLLSYAWIGNEVQIKTFHNAKCGSLDVRTVLQSSFRQKAVHCSDKTAVTWQNKTKRSVKKLKLQNTEERTVEITQSRVYDSLVRQLWL